MTLLAFLLFYIGLILRFTYADSEENFVAARFVSSIILSHNKVLLFVKVKLNQILRQDHMYIKLN
jgi:hypothetical protein